MNKLKIGALYLLLGAGGLWHVLGVFQDVMRVLASPIMFGLGSMAVLGMLADVCLRHESDRKFVLIVSIGVILVSFGIEWLGVRTGRDFWFVCVWTDFATIDWWCSYQYWVRLVCNAHRLNSPSLRRIIPKALTVTNPFKLALFSGSVDGLLRPTYGTRSSECWIIGYVARKTVVPLQNYLVWFGLSFIFRNNGFTARDLFSPTVA